jgi:putative ABC transport system permease protein
VIDRRTGALLAPYGAREAHGRDDQTSHAMLDNEIKEQRVLGTVLPVDLPGVAAFLLNVVVSRLVATQREQIAALKALGYANRAIAAHYLKLVLVIVLAGAGAGVALGDRLGAADRAVRRVLPLPGFDHRIAPCAGGGQRGADAGHRRGRHAQCHPGATVRLAPAEAMRPPRPGHYRRTLLERLGLRALPPRCA